MSAKSPANNIMSTFCFFIVSKDFFKVFENGCFNGFDGSKWESLNNAIFNIVSFCEYSEYFL